MTYYYPYFYKAHLISFSDSSVSKSTNSNMNATGTNNSTMNNNFTEFESDIKNCQICLADKNSVCLKCFSGYFLNDEGLCVEMCPEGYIADILRRKCYNINNNIRLPDVVFTKAYSFGSCKNNCMKSSLDCSCSADCARKADCCTDYLSSECEDLHALKNFNIANNITCKEKLNQCEICEESNSIDENLVNDDLNLFYSIYRKRGNLRKKIFNKRLSLRKDASYLKNINANESNSTNIYESNQTISSIPIKKPKMIIGFNPAVIANNTLFNIRNNNRTNNTVLSTIEANNSQTTDKKIYFCRQCKEGFIQFNGSCIKDCPKNFTKNLYSTLCVPENDKSLSKNNNIKQDIYVNELNII